MKFTADLRKFAEAAQSSLDEGVRAICIELFSGVISDSPVDTGRFRGNWKLGFGVAPEGTSFTTGDPSGPIVQELNGKQVLGERVWLVNNLPYADRLEYGWSQQAPDGMVRRNFSRVTANISTIIKRAAK